MARARTTIYTNERKMFYGACSLLIVVFAAYVYFVSASIVHVVVRKEINDNMATLHSEIGDLETRYIEAKRGFNEDTAARFGFRPIEERVFITKTPSSLVLSRNDES